MSKAKNNGNQSTMSRYVSFVMLCITIVVCGFFFFNVIKGFLLPLFLAALLAVIFRPLHEWVSHRMAKRPTLAAASSTAIIMLSVLVPLAGLAAYGIYEANHIIRHKDEYLDKLTEVRLSMGLQKPFAQQLDTIETEMLKLEQTIGEAKSADGAYLTSLVNASRDTINEQLLGLLTEARDAVKDLGNEKTLDDGLVPAVNELRQALAEQVPGDFGPKKNRAAEVRSLKRLLAQAKTPDSQGLIELVVTFAARLKELPVSTVQTADKPATTPTVLEQSNALTRVQVEYRELRTALLGGPLWKWGIELVNPSRDQIDEMVSKVFAGGASTWLPSLTNTATSFVTGLLVGLGIMSVALFYFFLDGPKMINAFMHLSPLDDRHEMELLQEFDKVSRAVVLATLLSAVAQGILGGIGYKIAGLESVFLLTLLTAVLALIPFVGAAAVWVPCCLYIAFIQENPDPEATRLWMYTKAGFLAVYGVLVVSMADNFIKPWVLKGQSKLHPLLALLSVLGGVQALGPIGILIGPMVVAFLQVLLTIFQREITSLDEELKAAD